MKKKYRQFLHWLKKCIKSIRPGKNAVKGASLGLLISTALLWLVYSTRAYAGMKDPWVLLFFFILALAALVLGFLARGFLKLLNAIPAFYRLAFLIALPLLFFMSSNWVIPSIILLLASLCGASVFVFIKTGFRNLSIPKRIISVLGFTMGFGGFITLAILYAQVGFELDPLSNAALSVSSKIEAIAAASPAKKGRYTVKTLSYGSGNDLHRPEYGAEVDIQTESVDGLAFIDNWDGFGGWWREKYWGFDARSLPLNARVWYPDGKGPFPLVLVVHGNHYMQDYSDPGYDYLGELLASKGMILVSVDENFINGSLSDIFGGLEKENDARGWLLLEHIRVLQEWNQTKDNPFYQKIDPSNLALIGHSRGGEAVAHAAMFNKLPFYPDDASVSFDYNYAIKSVVAIAPVDGQYEPGDSRTKIDNVNYFVIHGAQDGDVSSFMGSQQYERVHFSDSLYYFKAGLYVYGANHGQFNTSWGNNDIGNPFTGLLNLQPLLSAEDQEKIAQVYISAFLDITLKNKREYLPLFLDARKGKNWLPETIYLSQFEDSSLETIANFEEDFDLSTISEDLGSIGTKNLSVWREQEIQLKWQKKGSRALFVGWHYDLKEEEKSMQSLADTQKARYTIQFSPKRLDSNAAFVFSMAESQESAQPKSEGKWLNKQAKKDDENKAVEEEKEEEEEDDKAKKPIDFTIQLRDSSGQKITFPLSDFSPLQRSIEVVIMKMDFMMGKKQSEKVFQTFYFPIREMRKSNPNFNFSALEELSFIFDKSESGVVSIDNIGFMKEL